jgi:hypothetical protein
LTLNLPPEYEFMHQSLDLKYQGIQRHENSADLSVALKFSPQRPLQLVASVTIKNPLGQEWHFEIDFKVDRGKPIAMIVVESLLNKSGRVKAVLPRRFHSQTPFHAYFVQGSASEFSVDQEHGFLEPSLGEQMELPSSIVFEPKMYGKVLKGLFIVDTLESQFLFEVIGKTPEYVPPVVKASPARVGIVSALDEEQSRPQTTVVKRRGIYFRKTSKVPRTQSQKNPPSNLVKLPV